MKIGVVATSYPRWPGDAAGGFVAGHAAHLRSTGAEVEVLAAGQGLPAPGSLFYGGGAPEALEARPLDSSLRSSLGVAGLDALGVAGRSLGVYGAALGFSMRMVAAIAKQARRWDAIAAHWLAPSAIAAALATRKLPLLAIAHGGDVHLLERTRLLAPALALLVARDARIAFVSDELRRRALDAIPRALASRVAARSIVQAMGVDDDRSETIRSSRASRAAASRGTSSPLTLVILARLVPIKSIDLALAALALTRTPARLVIAGDGPLRAALTAQAAPLGDRVCFTGWLDADARDALLATADALLVPSSPLPGGRSEGAPLAAREALAAGIPVIASSTGGLVELAGNGAILVPPRDPHALATAIERLDPAPFVPRPEFGWRHVGAALDHHWREPVYAPETRRAQPRTLDWSSRPADRPGSPIRSGHLRVTPA